MRPAAGGLVLPEKERLLPRLLPLLDRAEPFQVRARAVEGRVSWNLPHIEDVVLTILFKKFRESPTLRFSIVQI